MGGRAAGGRTCADDDDFYARLWLEAILSPVRFAHVESIDTHKQSNELSERASIPVHCKRIYPDFLTRHSGALGTNTQTRQPTLPPSFSQSPDPQIPYNLPHTQVARNCFSLQHSPHRYIRDVPQYSRCHASAPDIRGRAIAVLQASLQGER
jgi:hypothetical protein